MDAKLHESMIERKAKNEAKKPFAPTFPAIHEETVRAAIQHVAYFSELTVKEIAREIGRAESTTYHKLEFENPLSIEEFCTIARYAASRGVTEILDLIIPDGFILTQVSDLEPGETLEGLETELLEDQGCVIEASRNGQPRRAQRCAVNGVATASKIARKVK